MFFYKLLKWLVPLFIIGFAAAVVYFFVTPTFSHDYKQLTERVEVGLKYTNPEENTVYFHPYIENPNPSSDLTLTHSRNFIKVCVLNKNGEVLENSVTMPEEETNSEEMLQTTLAPGEQEQNTDYYRVEFPEEADRIQLTFTGEVDDEYGVDEVEEIIEVNIDYLNI
ncbi:hypothetical protein [Salibacterium aidingense]|uniref:hypothetical protein n=1 Tax=Salibacterium aidingense TaxID=384933 RepID=UPI00040D8103|nr:hypothetical protein [Salibacterium aidingense]